jgi:hypothetical protein
MGWEEDLDALARNVDQAVEGAALEGLREHIRATTSAKTDSYGRAWPPGVDGDVLKNAFANVAIYGGPFYCRARLTTPEVFHHFGAGGSTDTREARRALESRSRKRAKEGKANRFHAPQRGIIPTDGNGIPPAMRTRILNLLQMAMAA